MKLYEVTRTKVTASDYARYAVGLLMNDIRTAKTVRVGTGGFSSFTAATNGTLQQGQAIEVYPTTNTSSYIRYYLDTDAKLKRMTNGATTAKVVAEFVTNNNNNIIFTAENHFGTNLTDNQNNRVIGVNLQFFQLQYPVVSVGAGGLYDFYQISAKVTRRTLE
jgi:hypothetical protein